MGKKISSKNEAIHPRHPYSVSHHHLIRLAQIMD